MAKTELPQSFSYEHCDVPDGVSLTQWAETARSQRKAQVAGGVFAAIATLAPIAISVRGTRSK